MFGVCSAMNLSKTKSYLSIKCYINAAWKRGTEKYFLISKQELYETTHQLHILLNTSIRFCQGCLATL